MAKMNITETQIRELLKRVHYIRRTPKGYYSYRMEMAQAPFTPKLVTLTRWMRLTPNKLETILRWPARNPIKGGA